MVLEVKSILEKYSGRKFRYIYRTKELDERGINYQYFIKLRFESITEKHIGELYSEEGWYVLWYLMAHAINKEYIKTTIKLIEEDIGMGRRLKDILVQLHKKKVISIKGYKSGKLIQKNDILEIVILYEKDEFYQKTISKPKGYKAMPVEFVKTIIPRLTPTEFAIYCVLVNYFRWFDVQSEYDDQNFRMKYYYRTFEYAFPTQEQIASAIGIDRKRIHQSIKSLAKLKLITYDPNEDYVYSKVDGETGRNKIINRNYRYKVELLQRVEYIYYHILSLEDKRSKDDIKKIWKKGFENIACSEEQHILKDRDYIEHVYLKSEFDMYYTLEKFMKAIKDKDTDFYDSYGRILGSRFENKDIRIASGSKKSSQEDELSETTRSRQEDDIWEMLLTD